MNYVQLKSGKTPRGVEFCINYFFQAGPTKKPTLLIFCKQIIVYFKINEMSEVKNEQRRKRPKLQPLKTTMFGVSEPNHVEVLGFNFFRPYSLR